MAYMLSRAGDDVFVETERLSDGLLGRVPATWMPMEGKMRMAPTRRRNET